MPKTTTKKKSTSSRLRKSSLHPRAAAPLRERSGPSRGRSAPSRARPVVFVSTGCPAGIGPEVSVAAASESAALCVLVGDRTTIHQAAELRRVGRARLVEVDSTRIRASDFTREAIPFVHVEPALDAADRVPGHPSDRSGQAQLAYVEAAYDWAVRHRRPLVTGPVSKEAIARSKGAGARSFRGHTEWLEQLDGAAHSVMCFAAPTITTSLVTTHVPLSKVSRAITADGVRVSTLELVELLRQSGVSRPRVAVCSLNPHAGEGELLGKEESQAIIPGIEQARGECGRRAELIGPIGAETAYRKAHSGTFDGVVAMYHDQATIPLKLVAFGLAVNVTMGLSIVRTSVDHGTGYDIAWTGQADPAGMSAAIDLGARLRPSRGRRSSGPGR